MLRPRTRGSPTSRLLMQTPEDLIETHAEPADPRHSPAQTQPSTIYMIRHGWPEERHLNCYYGQLDVPLSECGASSRAPSPIGSPASIDAIYSSDLSRAGYIADLLAEPRAAAASRRAFDGKTDRLDRAALERDHGTPYDVARRPDSFPHARGRKFRGPSRPSCRPCSIWSRRSPVNASRWPATPDRSG